MFKKKNIYGKLFISLFILFIFFNVTFGNGKIVNYKINNIMHKFENKIIDIKLNKNKFYKNKIKESAIKIEYSVLNMEYKLFLKVIKKLKENKQINNKKEIIESLKKYILNNINTRRLYKIIKKRIEDKITSAEIKKKKLIKEEENNNIKTYVKAIKNFNENFIKGNKAICYNNYNFSSDCYKNNFPKYILSKGIKINYYTGNIKTNNYIKDIYNLFSGINLIILDNKKDYIGIKDKFLDGYLIDDKIKLTSIYGYRNLNGRLDFHDGYDITINNPRLDIEKTCNKLKYKYKFYKKEIKKAGKYIKEINNKYCKTMEYKKLILSNKSLYSLYIVLNINKLLKTNSNCYIGQNIGYKGNLVGFGNYLLCETKDKVYTIFGHLDNKNIDYLIKNGLISKVSIFDKTKLSLIIKGLFENYYNNFDNKTKKWKGNPINNYFFFAYNGRGNIYKINFNKIKNKYLYLRYGNSGYSFGAHIHWGLLIKDYYYIQQVTNNDFYIKLLNIMFKNKKENINLGKYYYSNLGTF